jgi:hypothetical protein
MSLHTGLREKPNRKFTLAATALLVLGTGLPAHARQDKPQEDKQEHSQGTTPEQAKPPARDKKAAVNPQEHPKTENPKPPQEKAPGQDAHATPPAKNIRQDDRNTSSVHANNGQSQMRADPAHTDTTHAGQGRAHGKIDDAHYTAHFGSAHRFRVSEGDFRNHRFAYGGYDFVFIDPWPTAWAYSDDVYVVYVDGGYYMYDVVHPGLRIAVNIS